MESFWVALLRSFLIGLLLAGSLSGCSDSSITDNPNEQAKPSAEQALAELIRKAEGGDAGAQAELGKRYRTGDGVPKDVARAVEWIRKASELGNASAQSIMGTMYAEGEGVPKDAAKAVDMWRRAGAQGDLNGILMQGVILCSKAVTTGEYQSALEQIEKSATLGHDRAQTALGFLYSGKWIDANGFVCASKLKDARKSVGWLSQSAAKGDDQS